MFTNHNTKDIYQMRVKSGSQEREKMTRKNWVGTYSRQWEMGLPGRDLNLTLKIKKVKFKNFEFCILNFVLGSNLICENVF